LNPYTNFKEDSGKTQNINKYRLKNLEGEMIKLSKLKKKLPTLQAR